MICQWHNTLHNLNMYQLWWHITWKWVRKQLHKPIFVCCKYRNGVEENVLYVEITMMRINLLCLSELNAAIAAVVREWWFQSVWCSRRRRGFGVQATGITGEGIWALSNRFRLVLIVVGILCLPKNNLDLRSFALFAFIFWFNVPGFSQVVNELLIGSTPRASQGAVPHAALV